MSVKVSLQVPADQAAPGDEDSAPGFLVKADLMVVPRVRPSLLHRSGPFVAVVEHFTDSSAAEPRMIERIRCSCEEVHILGSDHYAGFRLTQDSTSFEDPGDVAALLRQTQDSRPDYGTDPETIAPGSDAPRVVADKVVTHYEVEEGQAGICRWVPWC